MAVTHVPGLARIPSRPSQPRRRDPIRRLGRIGLLPAGWGLAIGGGGANGAFAAGALYRLVSDLNLHFTVVSGSSTGALMAGPALLDQVEILNDLYRGGIRNRNILRRRNLLAAIVKGALASTEPLRNLVRAYTDIPGLRTAYKKEGRFACVSAVNLRTGRLARAWSRPRAGLENWVDWVVASASIPVVMDPVLIDGDPWADGCLVDAIPVGPLLGRGLDGIVVLANNPFDPEELGEAPRGISGRLLRAMDIMTAEIARRDLPGPVEQPGTSLIVIAPDRVLGDPLDFDPARMREIWAEGFDRAGESIEREKAAFDRKSDPFGGYNR